MPSRTATTEVSVNGTIHRSTTCGGDGQAWKPVPTAVGLLRDFTIIDGAARATT